VNWWKMYFSFCKQQLCWQRSWVVSLLVFGRRTSLPCARSMVDRWPLSGKLSATGQPTRPTQPSIPQGSVNE